MSHLCRVSLLNAILPDSDGDLVQLSSNDEMKVAIDQMPDTAVRVFFRDPSLTRCGAMF